MKAPGWISAGVVAALAAGACTYVSLGSARASDKGQQDDYVSAPVKYQNNPEIKCLPYVNVSKNVPQQVQTLVRNQQRQGCVACHQGNKPKSGRGDHPKVTGATALVYNASNEPVEYETRADNETNWQTVRLQPGKTQWHTHKYQKKVTYKSKTKKQRNQHRSPEVWVRYVANGKRQQQKLTLVATPNQQLGNVYYFDKKQDKVALRSPPKKMKLHR